MPFLTTLLLLTIVSAWVCYSVARRRRANHVYWLIMGILFGPLAIPFVFLSRPKNR
ncbi:MAG: hypothetical protein KJP04_02870 [Arenicella sp.]|nr:hypothetical protein [Arenicella sp.]